MALIQVEREMAPHQPMVGTIRPHRRQRLIECQAQGVAILRQQDMHAAAEAAIHHGRTDKLEAPDFLILQTVEGKQHGQQALILTMRGRVKL